MINRFLIKSKIFFPFSNFFDFDDLYMKKINDLSTDRMKPTDEIITGATPVHELPPNQIKRVYWDWSGGSDHHDFDIWLEQGVYEIEYQHYNKANTPNGFQVWWTPPGGEEHFMPAFNPDGSDLGYPGFPGVMANIYLFTGTEVGRIGDYIDYSNMTIEEAID